jgi:hypothetical protein
VISPHGRAGGESVVDGGNVLQSVVLSRLGGRKGRRNEEGGAKGSSVGFTRNSASEVISSTLESGELWNLSPHSPAEQENQ